MPRGKRKVSPASSEVVTETKVAPEAKADQANGEVAASTQEHQALGTQEGLPQGTEGNTQPADKPEGDVGDGGLAEEAQTGAPESAGDAGAESLGDQGAAAADQAVQGEPAGEGEGEGEGESVAPDAPAAQVADDAHQYPKAFTIRNHGSWAFTEPVTGKYLGPGQSDTIVLQDPAHAGRVLDNVASHNQAVRGEFVKLDALPDNHLKG